MAMGMTEFQDSMRALWEGVAEGWRQLWRSASSALTRFKPGSRTQLPSSAKVDDISFVSTGGWSVLGSDIFEDDKQVVVRLEIPGLDKDEFAIEVTDDSLVVSGEKRFEGESSDGRWRVVQCAYGGFRRVVPLPVAVRTDEARASYRNGVLKVELPKLAEGPPRRRSIRVD